VTRIGINVEGELKFVGCDVPFYLFLIENLVSGCFEDLLSDFHNLGQEVVCIKR